MNEKPNYSQGQFAYRDGNIGQINENSLNWNFNCFKGHEKTAEDSRLPEILDQSLELKRYFAKQFPEYAVSYFKTFQDSEVGRFLCLEHPQKISEYAGRNETLGQIFLMLHERNPEHKDLTQFVRREMTWNREQRRPFKITQDMSLGDPHFTPDQLAQAEESLKPRHYGADFFA